MASWIEAPPARQRRGMGCFAKGCLLLIGFLVLLAFAFTGGIYFAWNRILPTRSIDVPRVAIAQDQVQSAEQRWKAFRDAADLQQPARIELTADEINALIRGSDERWRGRLHVAVERNTGRVAISMPMDDNSWFKGRFINAEGTVTPADTKRPEDAQISNIVVNSQRMPPEITQWEFFGWSLHEQIADWCAEYNLKRFDIENGKVILETGPP